MNNYKGQPIKDGDILAPVSDKFNLYVRVMVLSDHLTGELYWRHQMSDVSIRNNMDTLKGNEYITIENLYNDNHR